MDKPPISQDVPLYEEDIAASQPIRAEQAEELRKYLDALQRDPSALTSVFEPDYSSVQAYESSTRRLRQALRHTLGYPPAGEPDREPPTFVQVGEDATATYYRVRISVLPGVHVVGLYLIPRNLRGRAPLVISMHGGGGSPELATFNGGANYHDLVRGAVERGYVVWAPLHLFKTGDLPDNIRQRVDSQARLVGTSIVAIEVTKIVRGLDVILKRPEVDENRVAMVGLSYGGFYTLFTAALEPRIKVAVSSCWFSDRAARLAAKEPVAWLDVRFSHGTSLFSDPEMVALICPRPLQIQVAERDELFPAEDAIRTAPLAAAYYAKLGLANRFEFRAFSGVHEFHGASAWEFVARHL